MLIHDVFLVGGPLDGKPYRITDGTKSLAIPCTKEGEPIGAGDPSPKVRGGWLHYEKQLSGEFVFQRQA